MKSLLRWIFLSLAVLAPAMVLAQEPPKSVRAADGAKLRALDMLTGKLQDIDIGDGETKMFERLAITLKQCRYPIDNPASDAFAYLVIRDIREDNPRFEGWMTAASPALSAMDHPRYDVWVLRCNIPAADAPDGG